MLNAHSLTLTRGTRTIITGAHIDVPKGGLLLLTGENGTGKTSLLRALAGLLPPDAGTITRHGDLHFISAAELKPDPTTPRQYLREQAALQNGAFTTDPFNITPYLDTPLNRLSTGWRQRVKLTRLTLCPRPLWLLDEPTTGLDKTAIDLFLHYISAHRASGGGVIIATHQSDLWLGAQTLNIRGHHA